MAETSHQYRMQGKVWLYQGKATWHFVTLPQKESQAIQNLYGGMKRGWGSLPVRVTIGKSVWTTSIFPDSKAGGYLLPLKADIRAATKIKAGDTVRFRIEIRI